MCKNSWLGYILDSTWVQPQPGFVLSKVNPFNKYKFYSFCSVWSQFHISLSSYLTAKPQANTAGTNLSWAPSLPAVDGINSHSWKLTHLSFLPCKASQICSGIWTWHTEWSTECFETPGAGALLPKLEIWLGKCIWIHQLPLHCLLLWKHIWAWKPFHFIQILHEMEITTKVHRYHFIEPEFPQI